MMTIKLDLTQPQAPPLPLRRFSVEQYHRLGELGVLSAEDQVELLEGWIVEKMNQRPIHGFIVRMLNEIFTREIPSGFICQCLLPITTDRSEPEPDIAVVRGSLSDFRDQHPRGQDCRLIIEVADTSLDKDRAKARIYQEAGVQDYWIINVNQRCVERYALTVGLTEPQVFQGDSTILIEIGGAAITLDLKRIWDC